MMDISDFNPIAGMAALWTREQLTPENLEWLRALPQDPVHVEGIPEAQFVHGSPVDEDEYVVTVRDAIEPLVDVSPLPYHSSGTPTCREAFRIVPADEVFRPVYRTVGQAETVDFPLQQNLRYMVNPGSVGSRATGIGAQLRRFDSDSGS